ncbi:hypothetical protein INR49_025387 [Caranx melampygus]|nr:hypothetical protein INR49_025387 [Caranx melampygus]
MGDKIVTKSVGLVLIATAHMILNGLSHAEVTGILGSNITLYFKFNDTVLRHNSHFAVYTTGEKKIAYCSKENVCSGGAFYHIYPENMSVLYHITNLSRNHSQIYWISLFDSGPAKESNRVKLIVQEENRTSTDKHQQPQQQNSNPTLQETIEDSSGVPPPTLVYSVLDFPKRPSAVMEMNPNDTEYAAVSYLPESRM